MQGQWQRYDPTFMIAPQRIDRGMQDYISEQRAVLGGENSLWRFQHYSILKNVRIWSDYASYQWQSKVLGYDAEKQNRWLEKLGLNSSYAYALILIFGMALLGMLYFLVYRWNMSQNVAVIDKIIHVFTQSLSAEQRKRPSETFQQWMLRLSTCSSQPDLFKRTNSVFQKIMYLEQNDKAILFIFKQLLKECATELKNMEKTCQTNKK